MIIVIDEECIIYLYDVQFYALCSCDVTGHFGQNNMLQKYTLFQTATNYKTGRIMC